MANKVLVVAAHPDDEILGLGGTTARHITNEDEVFIVIMATGLSSRGEVLSSEILELRQTAIEANGKLGIARENILFEDFPDNKMDTIARLDVIKVMEKHIKTIKPDIIYTHHAGDVNIDHRVTHDAVITAARPQPNFCVKKILCFETQSSTEWQSNQLPHFIPNYYVDVSSTLNQKLEALTVYSCEMRDFPHSRSIQAVEHLAKLRGSNVGLNACEAFYLVRDVC